MLQKTVPGSGALVPACIATCKSGDEEPHRPFVFWSENQKALQASLCGSINEPQTQINLMGYEVFPFSSRDG
jgi:hypothetical protein